LTASGWARAPSHPLDFSPNRSTKVLAGVGAQVTHNQVDGIGSGVMLGDVQEKIGEFKRRANGRHFGEMNTHLWLDAAENVGRSAA
jgi:hypothetical protein